MNGSDYVPVNAWVRSVNLVASEDYGDVSQKKQTEESVAGFRGDVPWTPATARLFVNKLSSLVSASRRKEINSQLFSKRIILATHGRAEFDFIDEIEAREFAAMAEEWCWFVRFYERTADYLVLVCIEEGIARQYDLDRSKESANKMQTF